MMYLYSLELSVKKVLVLRDGVEDLGVEMEAFDDYRVDKVEVLVKVGRADVWKKTNRANERLWINRVKGGDVMFDSRKYIETKEVNVLKNWRRVYCFEDSIAMFKMMIIERYKEVVDEEFEVLQKKKDAVSVYYRGLKSLEDAREKKLGK